MKTIGILEEVYEISNKLIGFLRFLHENNRINEAKMFFWSNKTSTMLPFSWSSKWVGVITSHSVSWRSNHLVIPRILVVLELSSVTAQRLARFEIAFFSPFHHGSQSKYFWVWNNVSLYECGSWHQNTALLFSARSILQCVCDI